MSNIYPLLYHGPVNYFVRLVKEDNIVLEQFDSYTKQTYRNRCRIIGPNGVLSLSIPVKRARGVKNLFRDIRIDYDTPWNKIHWKGLVAAYAGSPFYEFMADDLVGYYNRKYEFLVDLNLEILQTTLDLMGLNIPVELTTSFVEVSKEEDPREIIHPKSDIALTDPSFSPAKYHQVFSERHGFQSNMSILDLLFNQGPESLGILRNSIRT